MRKTKMFNKVLPNDDIGVVFYSNLGEALLLVLPISEASFQSY